MFKNIKYTLYHKQAFLKIQKELTGKNTINGYLHDIDKLFMYLFLPKNIVKRIHRKISKHHFGSFRKIDLLLTVIDWECARYTKIDKQLTARETLQKFFPDKKHLIEPILEQLNL